MIESDKVQLISKGKKIRLTSNTFGKIDGRSEEPVKRAFQPKRLLGSVLLKPSSRGARIGDCGVQWIKFSTVPVVVKVVFFRSVGWIDTVRPHATRYLINQRGML